jgi:hypothetical protein
MTVPIFVLISDKCIQILYLYIYIYTEVEWKRYLDNNRFLEPEVYKLRQWDFEHWIFILPAFAGQDK